MWSNLDFEGLQDRNQIHAEIKKNFSLFHYNTPQEDYWALNNTFAYDLLFFPWTNSLSKSQLYDIR